MKKSQRIARLVATLDSARGSTFDPRYAGYFTCFNAGEYYEAHDVLEDLWLEDRTHADASFYKGLIQLAGAFVHLKKQHARPDHPKDGGRLAPAARLFTLARRNLLPFSPHHRHLDVASVVKLCERWGAGLADSKFLANPWNPAHLPQIKPDGEGRAR